MNNIARNILLAVATIIPSGNALAQIPDGYYDALKDKKGAELKTAVHNIIKNANVLDYGSGKGSTWWGFYSTDNDNGYVIDRYSNNRVKFVSREAVASGMNIEHSFPKSWWGGSKNQAYKDLYNLMPSDSKANSSKSNYGMGIVTEVSYENDCIKVGDGDQGFKFGSRARSGRATSHADICTWRRLTRILHGRAKGSNRLRKATIQRSSHGLTSYT